MLVQRTSIDGAEVACHSEEPECIPNDELPYLEQVESSQLRVLKRSKRKWLFLGVLLGIVVSSTAVGTGLGIGLEKQQAWPPTSTRPPATTSLPAIGPLPLPVAVCPTSPIFMRGALNDTFMESMVDITKLYCGCWMGD